MAHARNTDPETSHEAAHAVTNTTQLQQHILNVLTRAMTDTELLSAVEVTYPHQVSASGVRTRRSELAAQGLVKDTGERKKLPSGRRAIVWGRA
jgi:hypothetical protein